MSSLLNQLSQDTLPTQMVESFVSWCVMDQARPALALILEKAAETTLAEKIKQATTLKQLIDLSGEAHKISKSGSSKEQIMANSAVEAAAFEFDNMMRATAEHDIDAESVSFFSARVCGWAGWASQNFGDVTAKKNAEQAAIRSQEKRLETLWKMYASR